MRARMVSSRAIHGKPGKTPRWIQGARAAGVSSTDLRLSREGATRVPLDALMQGEEAGRTLALLLWILPCTRQSRERSQEGPPTHGPTPRTRRTSHEWHAATAMDRHAEHRGGALRDTRSTDAHHIHSAIVVRCNRQFDQCDRLPAAQRWPGEQRSEHQPIERLQRERRCRRGLRAEEREVRERRER